MIVAAIKRLWSDTLILRNIFRFELKLMSIQELDQCCFDVIFRMLFLSENVTNSIRNPRLSNSKYSKTLLPFEFACNFNISVNRVRRIVFYIPG